MKVVVVSHDPAWKDLFRAEAPLVLRALGKNAVQAHHIGSTAILTIAAKPVIDLLVEVADIEAVDDCNQAMVALGYEALGECGIPARRYFRKSNAAGRRTHQVHVFAAGDAQVVRHLAFRDFMRQHPEWASRYERLKRELAEKHPDSIDDYMEGKDAFIKHVDELAAAWRRDAQR